MKARLAIDTEFNGFGGDLISMALVNIDSADARPFYGVLGCNEPVDWVAAYVMPILNQRAIDFPQFQHRLYLFLSKYTEVHIVADHPADIRYFCEALYTDRFGGVMPTPTLSFTIRRDLKSVSEQPHNALADAYGIAAAVKKQDQH